MGVRIDPPAAAAPAARLPLVDAGRGAALAAMAVYHLAWDLRYFGYVAVDVTEVTGWRIFARLIAGSFLFLVGVSLVLATRGGFRPVPFLKRLGVIAAAAAAISAVTFVMMPETFIFFGILHCIAVASLLGLLFVRAPLAAVAAAALGALLLPRLVAGAPFEHPALLWLGLSGTWPRSNDFVPLFPWFGVTLAGIAAARLLPLGGGSATAWQPRGPAGAWAAWAGRHSLAIYLLHQPLLFGGVYLAAQVAPPDLLAFEPAYVESCAASCIESGLEAGLCRRACQCVATRMQDAGLWRELMQGGLDPDQSQRYLALADACRAEAGG